jgi:hypothetical protein
MSKAMTLSLIAAACAAVVCVIGFRLPRPHGRYLSAVGAAMVLGQTPVWLAGRVPESVRIGISIAVLLVIVALMIHMYIQTRRKTDHLVQRPRNKPTT